MSTEAKPLRVALVSMPFHSSRYPSMQLGLLQAILERENFDARTFYINLEFAATVGWEEYARLCLQRCHFLGEWLFSRAAYREDAPAPDGYLETYATDLQRLCKHLGYTFDTLRDMRERDLPAFIDACVDTHDFQNYDVIGFGTVFEQNTAAFALARRLKERHPHIPIVFGGSNFDDVMGLEHMRTCPWIDYAIIGEADETFPAFLKKLAAKEDVEGMSGVVSRKPDGTIRFSEPSKPIMKLDSLPVPRYDDFFTTAAAVDMPETLEFKEARKLRLPQENARGCWWGAKHHCTFCGLNGMTMSFRSKTPARVLSDIEELFARHGVAEFEAVDNILDNRYIKEVFNVLAENDKPYRFFYEMKSNTTPEQLRMLAAGGMRIVQPGIESISTPVLKLMKKGTTSLQNIRFLKWAHYWGLKIAWNLLYGFPGETREHYEHQFALMQRISHLPPPHDSGRIFLERFSPYFTQSESFRLRNLGAMRSYSYVYPSYVDIDKVAYFFDYDYEDRLPDETYQEIEDHLADWQEAWRLPWRPYLYFERMGESMAIEDGRELIRPKRYKFDGLAADLYELCNVNSHNIATMLSEMRERYPRADENEVKKILDEFLAADLMLEEDGQYLSLALPLSPNKLVAIGRTWEPEKVACATV